MLRVSSRMPLVGGVLLACLAFARFASAAEVEPTAAQIAFFEKKVRPLLAERCYECHGPEEQTSDLRLDTWEGIFKGGETGPAVVAGRPEQSLLITAIGYQAADLQMPPDKKLSETEIAVLTEWVKIGAPHPNAGKTPPPVRKKVDDAAIEDGRSFWAFQPPLDSATPTVKNTDWPQSPLDHFILAALEAKGLKPAPPADKRTLIRRATFDLIGLPPTPDEIDDFLDDDSPNAFAKVVDRLLDSPHYGERWGRHWLDVARYADSNGLDENVAYGNAWRYRDYVVAAFNKDKPYDQFLLEQLAGDLLPGGDDEEPPSPLPLSQGERGVRTASARHERLIATGFLSLGPKVLAEVDETKMEMDIVDEQIDTFGRAILGLTLGCARCHDHKFDPVATEDYYALAGIFKSTFTMESFKKIGRWHENSLATPADLERKASHEAQVAQQKSAVQNVIDAANRRLQDEAKPGFTLPKNPETLYPAETKDELKRLREELAQLEQRAPEMPTAMGAKEGTVTNAHVHVRGSHLTLGNEVPRRFPQVLVNGDPLEIGPNDSGRLQMARWLVNPDHPLTSRVMVNRLWRWHFGEGLVRSTDNFGRLGETPSNQPLLDWLARRFVDGWSMKAMHRLIMLSSAYQMSSDYNAEAAEIDPDNRLLWRRNIRRLEAEAVRDSLLAVAGLLDKTMGGSLLHVKNRGYLFDHTSLDNTRYDSRRRSIYLPIIRNNLYDVFSLFDYSDASVLNGDRATSTVAPQALFLMNSDLVAEAAEQMAANLLKPIAKSEAGRNPEPLSLGERGRGEGNSQADDRARIHHLYLTAYGRPPQDEEATKAAAFVTRIERALAEKQTEPDRRRLEAWAALCHVIVSSNEFFYVP